MKTTILLALLMVSVSAIAEQLDSYKASNGVTYNIGDNIKLGRGSAKNGDFLYLQMGGWGAIAGYNTNGGSDQFNIGRGYSGQNVIIRKIKSYMIRGSETIYFIVAGGNITNYNLMIEDAIATCEITDCVRDAIPVTVMNTPSKLDELKKLKELFDSGAITQDEYQTEKDKLLKNNQ